MLRYIVLVLFTICAVELHAQSPLRWQETSGLIAPHVHGAIVKIGADQAYYIGGFVDAPFSKASRTVHRFALSAASQGYTIEAGPQLPIGLAEIVAVNLDDTAIVVLGGVDERNAASSDVYMFSLRSQTWRRIGNLLEGRRQHAGFLLTPTKVMVAGGRRSNLTTIASAEVFDLETGRSVAAPDFPAPVNGSTSGRMTDGQGVIAGGRQGGANSDRIAEIYRFDLSQWQWRSVDVMSSGREAPFSFRLADGRFAIVGGSVAETPLQFIGDCLIESNGRFVLRGSLPQGLVYAGITEHEPGTVLIVGGMKDDGNATDVCSFWNVDAGTVVPAPKLNYARRYTRSVTLGSSSAKNLVTFAISGAPPLNTRSVEVLKSDCTPSATIFDLGTMKLSGAAAHTTPTVTLTPAAAYQAGAAWLPAKLPVRNGFDIRFRFRMKNGNDNGLPDEGPVGADGIAVVMQNTSSVAVGSAGDGIGYSGIPSGLAIEFDAYLNPAFSDPTPNHIAIQVGDGQVLKPWHVPPYLKSVVSDGVPQFVADGRMYWARILYTDGRLSVFCDTTGALSTPLATATGLDLETILKLGTDGATFLGFTSATGFSQQSHEIFDLVLGTCDALVSVQDDDQRDESMIRVTPIPASDIVRVELSTPVGAHSRCRIVDINGREVAHHDLAAGCTTVQIPVAALAPGVYYLEVADQGSTHGARVVVMR
ncbi:MAG: hypothetical protein RL594_834 [Bacteroidota bacterium]|jgi:hypothetical protein